MRTEARRRQRVGFLVCTGVMLVMARTEMLPAGVTPPVVKTVAYRNAPTGRAYLCRPKGKGPFPVVIYHHGGFTPKIGGCPRETCQALARAGFIGLAPIRRQTVQLKGQADDVKASIEYARQLEGVAGKTRKRIGMIGFSRGGLLVLMAGTQRRDLAALVVMAPAPGRGAIRRVLSRAGEIKTPVLTLVAANDRVGVDHVKIAREVDRTLKSVGNQSRLIVCPAFGNDGHRMFFQVGDYWKDVVKFLEQRLGSTD
ncbi:MAG: dienelactone hydrolase family protein [Planctomycetaceae bacterium]